MSKTSNKEFEKDLHLSHFTLENLQEDIFWLDEKGNIIRVNESASKTCGYPADVLLQMSIFDLNPSEKKSNWSKHWATLKAEKKIRFETKHKHKEGYLYDIEVCSMTNNILITLFGKFISYRAIILKSVRGFFIKS